MTGRFVDDPHWDTDTYVVHGGSRSRAVGANRTLLVMYDKDRQLDDTLCNVSRMSGDVCRMPRGHHGLHVPFSGELVAISGVYVAGVAADQEADKV